MNRVAVLFIIACLPLRSLKINSSFGYRVHPVTGKYTFHAGVDLRARGDTVFAVLPGRVIAMGFHPLLGVFVKLDHGDLTSCYGHLSQVFVLAGDSVRAGSPVGITGASGRVTGEHLHFSVSFHGRAIDPIQFLLNIQQLNLKSNHHE
jgi:murein DD-endopeptidase MepM/ murein hydrolase activator NlpD